MRDDYYMARALQLAERGLFTTHPNPRVGCVIVKDGTILAEGWHKKAGQAHAEINALAELSLQQTQDSECYITLEPCSHRGRTPPCADSLIKAGIKRTVIAMKDPNPLVAGRGVERLQQAGIEVSIGLMEQQAKALNRGFCQRMQQSRPFVRSKIAMSLDGRTAMASGESKWITGIDARADVQKLRAQSSAILTGSGTVLADDPELTVRINHDEGYPEGQTIRQPLIVIVDSHGSVSPDARVFSSQNQALIANTQTTSKKYDAEQIVLPSKEGQVDLTELMSVLARREINEVLVEAGPKLNGTLLQAGLIDELIIYMAPKLMGDSANGLFHLPDLQTMADNVELTIIDIRAVGKDWRITAVPTRNES